VANERPYPFDFNQWCITLPSARGELVCVDYREDLETGFIEVPVAPTDEAIVEARAMAAVSQTFVRRHAHPAVAAELESMLRAAFRLGHLEGMQTRVACPMKRDQMRALVNVMKGWPL
jgi:hypothetical protein